MAGAAGVTGATDLLPNQLSRSDAGRGRNASPSGSLKILHVVGNERSGSTIFSLLLGAHPQLFYGGELIRFPDPVWTPGRYCSCQSLARECPFWAAVVSDFGSEAELERLRRGQVEYEAWTAMAGSLLAQAFRTHGLREHVRTSARFLRLAAERSGKEFVVDSSKSPLRGRLYSFFGPERVEVYWLHLVRDGRSYVSAEIPRDRIPFEPEWAQRPFVRILQWTLVNFLSGLFCSGRGRHFLRLRYEDFVARPQEVLTQVGRFVGVDPTPWLELLRSGGPIPQEHTIGAGRVRLARAPQLAADNSSWRRNLRLRIRLMFWPLAGWLSFRYGYRAQP